VKLMMIVVTTALYAALTILGYGNFSGFFSEPARTATLVVLFAASGFALFTDAGIRTGVREDRANRWVLAAFGVLGIFSAYLPAYTDRRDFWVVGNSPIRWIGVVLFAGGTALRLYPAFVLGRRFSGLVAIQPGHTLVTDGVYGVVRNPSYLGLLIGSAGWALVFRSGVGLLLVLLMLVPLMARIRAEERLLRSEFGDEYIQYTGRTWRLVPGIY